MYNFLVYINGPQTKSMDQLYFIVFLFFIAFSAQAQEDQTIFYNATIVDVQSGKLLKNQEVIVSKGKIQAVRPISKISRHKDAQIINAKGKYIVPGFWDMHAHVLVDNNFEWQAPLLLANGIIGIREMWGREMRLADSLKRAMQKGSVPYLHFTAPGHIIDGKKVFWPGQLSAPNQETAIRIVDSLVDEKVDFIKIYSYLEPAVFDAIAGRCKQ